MHAFLYFAQNPLHFIVFLFESIGGYAVQANISKSKSINLSPLIKIVKVNFK